MNKSVGHSVEALTPGAQVERQLEQVAARLADEYRSFAPEIVRGHVRAEQEQFVDARVTVFVPILVERAVRDKLRAS